MNHTPKITFDGCGLNDLHDPFRRRLFTARIQDWEELREIGPYIETACNAHEELVAALHRILDGNTMAGRENWTHADVIQEHYKIARKALTTIEKGA